MSAPPPSLARFALLCLAWLLVACAPPVSSSALPTPLPTRPAALTEAAVPGGVLLVSVEGVPPNELQAALANEALPTLARLAARGYQSALVPVPPTQPESAAATLLSARPPTEHGWVGLPTAPPLVPFWGDEGNLYTALVGPWPGAGPTLADAGVMPGERLVESMVHQPTLAPAQPWEAAPPSFSPRLEARLPLPRPVAGVEALWLLAVDTLNDGVVAYDQYWLAPTRKVGPESARLDAREPGWATLPVGEQTAVDLLLLDGDAAGLLLYQSQAVTTQAWPAPLAARLRAEVGFYPPDPDIRGYQQGWLSAEQLTEMGNRQSAWLARAAAWLWASTPDGQRPLVMSRWPALGHLYQALWLVDPAQPGWQQARQQRLLAVRESALTEMEQALTLLLAQVDLSQHALVLTVPLGMEPLRQEISLPLLAQAAGLEGSEMVPQEGGAWLRPPVASSKESFEAALTAVMEPESQQPLVERVVAGEQIGGAEAAGWWWLQARSGYGFSFRHDGALVTPTVALGAWGGEANRPELAGWGLVVGRGVRPTPARAAAQPLADFVSAPAHLLGLPRFATLPAPPWLDDR